MLRLKYLFNLFIVLGPLMVYGQCPVADFSVPDTVCIGENIKITNNSVGGVQYEWDFCSGDLQNSPVKADALTNGLFNKPVNITLVKDATNWYGFIASRFGKRIVRLDFGGDLLNTPTLVDLGTFNNSFTQSIDIEFISEGDKWYALLIDISSNKLWRLSFNSITDTSPTLEPLDAFNSADLLNAPTDIEIIEEKDSLTAVVVNYNSPNVTQLNFGNSITNSPTGININISSGSNLSGVSALKICDKWNIIFTSRGNNKIFSLKYNQGLTATPTIGEIIPSGISVSAPIGVDLVNGNGVFYAFIQSFNGDLYRLQNAESLIPAGTNLGNSSELTSANQGVKIIQSSTNWYGFLVNINANSITRMQFPGDCYSNTSFSILQNPAEISYNQSGNYNISLKTYDSIGNFNTISKPMTVLNSQAPGIDMETMNSLCIDALTSFQGSSPDSLTISSWQWDFGDTNTATGQEVTHQYTTPGTYTVTLEVESADGCGNRFTKEITIYEPPVPKFSIPDGLLCSNGAMAFTNLTDTQGADDIITYTWDFNGEGTSTEVNPSFTFATGGSKTVTLTAGIPGCSEVYDTTFTVVQGPQVDFVAPQICQGAEFVFENLTTGDNITEYYWEFGDGGTFTSANANPPFYTYDTDSTFTVTLTVKNAAGCTNSASRNVTVYTRPQVAFLVEVACAGKSVSFTDQTTAGTTANVISWQWDFGDGTGSANIRNPEYTYSQPGTYLVKLVTQTSAGCRDSLIREVVVESPVTTGFSYAPVCAEGAAPYTIQFTDQSTVTSGNKITDWLWMVNGESFITRDMQYTFAAPGTYQVSLTAIAATACNAVITKNVIVSPKPEVAFSYTGTCAGEPFAFVNETVNADTSVSRFVWDFGGAGISFEDDPQFAFSDPGSYTVVLTAEMTNGCAFSSEQTLEVLGKPVAQFTPSATFGAVPLVVQLDNQSQYASQYLWQIGESDTLSEDSPEYTFSQPGTYEVTLTAQNASGCASTMTKTITTAEPAWDMVIENMKLFPDTNSGEQQIILTIRNAGTVTVENFPISIKIDALLELQEAFKGRLAPGERMNYPLTFTLSEQVSGHVAINYICATLLDGDTGLSDIKVSDNRACVNMSQTSNSIVPYPNPVSDYLDVSLVLSSPELVRIRIENMQGKQLRAWEYADTQVGLNSFPLDMSGFAPGNYLLQVQYPGKKQAYRIIVHP